MSPMDGLGSAAEGVYTSRVRADAESAQIRTDRATDARGNLAAIVLERHGIKPSANPADLPAAVKLELVELAQALGLDGAARRPGYCACGKELTITGGSVKAGGTYKAGKCLRCSREDR